jgi:endonuclease/exonuclease/phosphatase family metal-dependent hydrolase
MIATHPAAYPMLPLDRIYSDSRIAEVRAHRTGLSRMASDHLPLVARMAD